VGGRIPVTTMLRLLGHSDRVVAAAAAIGEWNSASRGEVRSELRDSWRAAVLRTPTSESSGGPPDQGLDFWLGTILASDPDLALDWLRARLDQPESLPFSASHSPFADAIGGLSSVQRTRLLDSLRPLPDNRLFVRELLTLMIGRDVELFQVLLERGDLAATRLAPLRGRPDPEWAELANLALKQGASAEEVIDEVFSVSHASAGFGIEYWPTWATAFGSLLSDLRPEIREIGRLGSERVQLCARRAEKSWNEKQRRGF
jgi:hypothetical protein